MNNMALISFWDTQRTHAIGV